MFELLTVIYCNLLLSTGKKNLTIDGCINLYSVLKKYISQRKIRIFMYIAKLIHIYKVQRFFLTKFLSKNDLNLLC